MIRPITRPIHAVLDYIYAGQAMAAPKALNFHDRKASLAAEGVGTYALATGVFSKHEGGLVKALPFNTHLKMDILAALLTLGAPWRFGFAHNRKARNTFVGLAALELAVVALSEPDNGSMLEESEEA
jgi:hypothetical protein